MSDKVAYLNFPKETKYIGAGDVNRIRKSCGDLKVPKIVEEIKQVESKRKTPLSHEQRQEIIKKYERPRTDTENREESIRYLKAENERLWNILKDERRSYQEHLTELEKENQKLKTAIKKYHKQRAA
jgi:flagellar capping protein FliD